MIRRRELKQTVTEKLTKRLAVSLASLRSFQRRFRHATSQSSITVVEISNEMQSDIKNSSEKISIDESSSEETIKASSYDINATNSIEIHQSPYIPKGYVPSSPQRHLGSHGGQISPKSQSESSFSSEKGSQSRIPFETSFDSCETLRRGLDLQDEENGTNGGSADHEPYHNESEISDHEDESSSEWGSPI